MCDFRASSRGIRDLQRIEMGLGFSVEFVTSGPLGQSISFKNQSLRFYIYTRD